MPALVLARKEFTMNNPIDPKRNPKDIAKDAKDFGQDKLGDAKDLGKDKLDDLRGRGGEGVDLSLIHI